VGVIHIHKLEKAPLVSLTGKIDPLAANPALEKGYKGSK
jgi:hypothetical protein